MLGRVEVGNGDEDLGQLWVIVLTCPNTPFLEPECFGMNEDFFSKNFVQLFGW
jgi:hypothetical protein